jgi:hypothetical protein
MKLREWRCIVKLHCCHYRGGGDDLECRGGGDDLWCGGGRDDLEHGGGGVIGTPNRGVSGPIWTRSVGDQIHIRLHALREIQRRW